MRRLLRRTLVASLAALVLVMAMVWYASVHRHIPDGWPRIYVASNCGASEFAMMVAEHSQDPLVTIPVDDGELSDRACHHTKALMADRSLAWSFLGVLPDSLVCARLIRDGSMWMIANRHDEWGDGAAAMGEHGRGQPRGLVSGRALAARALAPSLTQIQRLTARIIDPCAQRRDTEVRDPPRRNARARGTAPAVAPGNRTSPRPA